jgi:hypothetical protein
VFWCDLSGVKWSVPKRFLFVLVKAFLSQAKEEFNQKWEKPAQVKILAKSRGSFVDVERVIDLSLKGTMQKESALGNNNIFRLLN